MSDRKSKPHPHRHGGLIQHDGQCGVSHVLARFGRQVTHREVPAHAKGSRAVAS